jgi:hypothetical protein
VLLLHRRIGARPRALALALAAGGALALAPAVARAQGATADTTRGDPPLATSWLAPGAASWQLVMARGGQEQPIGTVEETIAVDSLAGRAVLRRVLRTETAMGVQADSAWLDPATLAPLRRRSGGLRAARLDWADGRVRGQATPPSGGAARVVDAALERPAFDVAALDLVVASLPLARGYATRLPVYVPDAGGVVEATVEVVGSEPVRVGGVDVEAWKVATNAGGQRVTWWIADDSRQTARVARDAGAGAELRLVQPPGR